jgi:3-phenylpropionate/trans-cinnamate dioxygenase ferredoxin reductase component
MNLQGRRQSRILLQHHDGAKKNTMTGTVVIAGAGHAAGQAVATLKQKKYAGRIVLLGDEPYLPYQRPPLSKKYLAGEMPAERLHFKPESFYAEPNIDVRLQTRIASIDRDSRRIGVTSGEEIAYDALILATGSRVRKLPVEGSDLAGVHYLRTIGDVDAIRAELAPGRRILIVGAGYIGLEVAAVCRQLGHDVTVIEMAERVMSRVVSPQVSDFYQNQHTMHGVTLRLSTGLGAFVGDDRVTGVATTAGDTIAADLVVVGVGILPNTELAEAAGLPVDNGIVVDDRCRTSDAAIYAIGDCTSHPSSIYARRIRLESVHNALEQARTAAANICGEETRYSDVPWFWSDQYDLKLQIAGLSQGYEQAILRGEPGDAHFSCAYLRDEVLIAIDAINAPKDFMQAKPLIANRVRCDTRLLADASIPLRDLPR